MGRHALDWTSFDATLSRMWLMFDVSTIADAVGVHEQTVRRRAEAIELPPRKSKEFRSARLRLAREVGHSPNTAAACVAASVPDVSPPKLRRRRENEPGASYFSGGVV